MPGPRFLLVPGSGDTSKNECLVNLAYARRVREVFALFAVALLDPRYIWIGTLIEGDECCYWSCNIHA
jgi:hypothetical protein